MSGQTIVGRTLCSSDRHGYTSPVLLDRLTLPALLAQWARIVDFLDREAVTAEAFCAHADVRHAIARRMVGKPVTRETREMLNELDTAYLAATAEQTDCVHGADRAMTEGWTPQREWYYWRVPHKLMQHPS